MKTRTALLLATCVMLIASGCATRSDWEAVSGSKSDGVVTLRYELAASKAYLPDEPRAIALAKQRCGYWGFSSAKAFDTQTQHCSDEVCRTYIITKDYQCIN